MDIDINKVRDGIEKLHTVLVRENIRDTESLWHEKFVFDSFFDMNKFFDVFQMSQRFPKIVKQNEYDSYNTEYFPEMYSGSQYINATASQFQKGNFRANEFGFYGIGYYFSQDIEIARNLNIIEHVQNDVMRGKIVNRQRVVNLLDLDLARFENFPQTSEDFKIYATDDFDRKANIISRLFDYDAHKAIWALLFGFDAVTEQNNLIINVINRAIVLQTKEPAIKIDH